MQQGALFEEVPGIFLTLSKVAQAYGYRGAVPPEDAPYCGDPWHFMRVAPSGDVFMCPTISEPAGNLTTAAPLDIFNGKAYNRLRQQLRSGAPPPQCATCPYSGRGLARFRREHDRLDAIISRQLALQPTA